MAQVHRDTDKRSCGASTNAANPNVYTNSLLTAIDGNPNSHGGGGLNASNPNVYIGGVLVVVNGNSANPDAKCPIPPHCNPAASSGSPNVNIGG
jgi:uncharacterized Zn-binding protein involved in type VI secretion